MRQGFLIIGLMLATQVFAEGAPSSAAAQADLGGGALTQMLMVTAVIAIFYFLMLRPQNKRAKEHRDLILNLTKGDEVVTTGGILGKINRVTDDFFVLIVSEGVEITLQKQAVAGVLPKGTLKSI